MLKFFRKIRQKLLSDSNVSKYLLYAAGEILLVVIGILIALQINNWNEAQKLKGEEIKLLQVFHSSLKGDLEVIQTYTNAFNTADQSIYIILEHMDKDLAFHDSLSWRFRYTTALWSPSINQEVFQTLTSRELNLISNDSLKADLTEYYSFAAGTFDVRFNRYAGILEEASRNIFRTRFNSMWNNTWNDPHYKDRRRERDVKPLDFEALKKDTEYRYFLTTLKNQLYWNVRNPLKEAEEKAILLIAQIEDELVALGA